MVLPRPATRALRHRSVRAARGAPCAMSEADARHGPHTHGGHGPRPGRYGVVNRKGGRPLGHSRHRAGPRDPIRPHRQPRNSGLCAYARLGADARLCRRRSALRLRVKLDFKYRPAGLASLASIDDASLCPPRTPGPGCQPPPSCPFEPSEANAGAGPTRQRAREQGKGVVVVVVSPRTMGGRGKTAPAQGRSRAEQLAQHRESHPAHWMPDRRRPSAARRVRVEAGQPLGPAYGRSSPMTVHEGSETRRPCRVRPETFPRRPD